MFFAPSHQQHLDLYSILHPGARQSQVDDTSFDDREPKPKRRKHALTIHHNQADRTTPGSVEHIDHIPAIPVALEAVVGPGDSLFIPSMWFHHVITLDDWSWSVNIWSDSEVSRLHDQVMNNMGLGPLIDERVWNANPIAGLRAYIYLLLNDPKYLQLGVDYKKWISLNILIPRYGEPRPSELALMGGGGFGFGGAPGIIPPHEEHLHLHDHYHTHHMHSRLNDGVDRTNITAIGMAAAAEAVARGDPAPADAAALAIESAVEAIAFQRAGMDHMMCRRTSVDPPLPVHTRMSSLSSTRRYCHDRAAQKIITNDGPFKWKLHDTVRDIALMYRQMLYGANYQSKTPPPPTANAVARRDVFLADYIEKSIAGTVGARGGHQFLYDLLNC